MSFLATETTEHHLRNAPVVPTLPTCHAMDQPSLAGREKRWVEEALEATAPDLRDRLGGDEAIVDSHVAVGNVSGYLCRR